MARSLSITIESLSRNRSLSVCLCWRPTSEFNHGSKLSSDLPSSSRYFQNQPSVSCYSSVVNDCPTVNQLHHQSIDQTTYLDWSFTCTFLYQSLEIGSWEAHKKRAKKGASMLNQIGCKREKKLRSSFRHGYDSLTREETTSEQWFSQDMHLFIGLVRNTSNVSMARMYNRREEDEEEEHVNNYLSKMPQYRKQRNVSY